MILILSIIALTAVLKSDGVTDATRHAATLREMNALAFAIRGPESPMSPNQFFGYLGDVGALPASLSDLTTNPGYATWNGPYLTQTTAGDYSTDAWGSAYTYTGLTIQSSGSGSTITKSLAPSADRLLNNIVQGIILDARRFPPGVAFRDSVQITISYPDGTGSYASATVNPSAAGSFNFAGIPVGAHTLSAVSLITSDTVSVALLVLPGELTASELTFPVALW